MSAAPTTVTVIAARLHDAGCRFAFGIPGGEALATIGPGVSNAINVVANAQQDRVPLIFLTGCLAGAHRILFSQVWDCRAPRSYDGRI